MRPLRDQTILVTGATDGLGRALAGRLAAGGAALLIHGRSDVRGEPNNNAGIGSVSDGDHGAN